MLLLTACGHSQTANVRKVVVHRAALRSVLPETGLLQIGNVITVPAEITGNIGSLNVRVGEHVKHGQPLARVVDMGHTVEDQRLSLEASLSKAAVEMREAERAYQTDRYLYAQQGIAHDALMQSQARLSQARIAYLQASQELRLRQNDERLIRAPFDGIIESIASHPGDDVRPLEPGDPIVAGQALLTMAGHEHFVVRAKIDEQDIPEIRIGQRAVIAGENLNGARLPGRVIALASSVQRSDDPMNASRHLIATIALRKQLAFLRDGMTVDVDIITHDEPRALVAPLNAIARDKNGAYVFVLRDGAPERTRVRLGAGNDTQIALRSGVRAGDILVIPEETSAP